MDIYKTLKDIANQSRQRNEYVKRIEKCLKTPEKVEQHKTLIRAAWKKRTSKLVKFTKKSWFERQKEIIDVVKKIKKGEVKAFQVKTLKSSKHNIPAGLRTFLMKGKESINSSLALGRDFYIEDISNDGLYIYGYFIGKSGAIRYCYLLSYDISVARSGLIIYYND